MIQIWYHSLNRKEGDRLWILPLNICYDRSLIVKRAVVFCPGQDYKRPQRFHKYKERKYEVNNERYGLCIKSIMFYC